MDKCFFQTFDFVKETLLKKKSEISAIWGDEMCCFREDLYESDTFRFNFNTVFRS